MASLLIQRLYGEAPCGCGWSIRLGAPTGTIWTTISSRSGSFIAHVVHDVGILDETVAGEIKVRRVGIMGVIERRGAGYY